MDTDDCKIHFLNDKYLIKEVKDADLDEQFLLVLDATACTMAEEVDLPINRVQILPGPFTFHAIVPGKSVEEQNSPIDIHQKMRLCGPLLPEEEGLTWTVVQNMAKHDDLSAIAAFDTFVGNRDRSGPNLFYDSISDRYFGIDLAAAFCSNLAKTACEQVGRFGPCSFAEKRALQKYLQVLQRLISHFPPERTCALLEKNAKQVGLEKIDRLHFHRKRIWENFSYCLQLSEAIAAYIEISG